VKVILVEQVHAEFYLHHTKKLGVRNVKYNDNTVYQPS